jgi:O-antigen/teichoic acid export membrane protein
LHFVYGPEYVEYAYLLDLFIWVYALIFIGTIAQLIIKTLNRNHSIFFAYVASVIAALLLAKPLLESFQLSGVIIGFGILQLITLSVYFITIKSALK